MRKGNTQRCCLRRDRFRMSLEISRLCQSIAPSVTLKINAMAAQLREKDDSCALIFVTSSDAFAVASYDVQAAYYFLKPLDTNKLTKVLDSIQIKRA